MDNDSAPGDRLKAFLDWIQEKPGEISEDMMDEFRDRLDKLAFHEKLLAIAFMNNRIAQMRELLESFDDFPTIRAHRVEAFCQWLETLPGDKPFHAQPVYPMLFGDLTQDELLAASNVLSMRAAMKRDEADQLRTKLEKSRDQ